MVGLALERSELSLLIRSQGPVEGRVGAGADRNELSLKTPDGSGEPVDRGGVHVLHGVPEILARSLEIAAKGG